MWPVTGPPPPGALRAAALGVATGGRSSAGIVAVVASSQPGDRAGGSIPRVLAAPYAKPVAAVMLAGELVADKLPSTPSRLMPPALLLRLVAGSFAAGASARRQRLPVVVPAALGGLGAAVGSVAGLRWRQAAAARGIPDLPAAVGEDVLVLALAWWAVRR